MRARGTNRCSSHPGPRRAPGLPRDPDANMDREAIAEPRRTHSEAADYPLDVISRDRTPEARRAQIEALRPLGGERRLARALEISAQARELSIEGLLANRPGWTEPGREPRSFDDCWVRSSTRPPTAAIRIERRASARRHRRGARPGRDPAHARGSFASSYHGDPRTTHDIGLVVDPTREALLAFVRSLDPSVRYVSEEAAREELEPVLARARGPAAGAPGRAVGLAWRGRVPNASRGPRSRFSPSGRRLQRVRRMQTSVSGRCLPL